MKNYTQNHLNTGENIINESNVSWIVIVPHIILLFFFVGIFTIWKPLIAKFTTELCLTNKKIVGKIGFLKTKSLDAPLDKINNISVSSGFWGKILNYGNVRIDTSSGIFEFSYIKNAEEFKTSVLNQIELYKEEQIKKQAEAMANAIK